MSFEAHVARSALGSRLARRAGDALPEAAAILLAGAPRLSHQALRPRLACRPLESRRSRLAPRLRWSVLSGAARLVRPALLARGRGRESTLGAGGGPRRLARAARGEMSHALLAA
ncbi:hypothetical protein [Nocardiopsis sp. CNR-923]|uniref:hypothetical protein n=1 Tax=Nocardiopsis sp. CNR-923 TaxID=1904965 RepID=UPI001180682A|nr:hypothetical protein [Nocardiopsis sp. CNR-923]